jgi:hypothetical protein
MRICWRLKLRERNPAATHNLVVISKRQQTQGVGTKPARRRAGNGAIRQCCGDPIWFAIEFPGAYIDNTVWKRPDRTPEAERRDRAPVPDDRRAA